MVECRDHQAVVWDDGGAETVAVWLRGGSLERGQPWLFLGELVATPLLIPIETCLAVTCAFSDDARIAWGPLGYVASLLPGFTCMPVQEHPGVWLHLGNPLPLPASERERLRHASTSESVEWLVEQYQHLFPDDAMLPGRVRRIVASVELEMPH